MTPLILAAILCATIWSDTFPVPVATRQYGPGVMQEVKVEVCGQVVRVSTRLYRDVATTTAIIEEPIVPWTISKTQWVEPRPPGPQPPPDQVVVP